MNKTVNQSKKSFDLFSVKMNKTWGKRKNG